MPDGSDQSVQDIRATVEEALRIGSRIACKYFRKPVPVDIKSDDSPVTLADREIEAAIRALIGGRFPDHGILGEEEGASFSENGTWVIDPIDGTKSFLFGNPLFGCLVGFVKDDVVQVGGMAAPALDEIWIADRSGPTTLNGKVCRASDCTELADASLLTSSPDFFEADELARFETLSGHVRYRRFGGDCCCYVMLAGGWVDLVVESSLHPFDYLPLVAIVEQAGGVMTDWSGNPLGLKSGPRVIAAATPALHKAALAVLNA